MHWKRVECFINRGEKIGYWFEKKMIKKVKETKSCKKGKIFEIQDLNQESLLPCSFLVPPSPLYMSQLIFKKQEEREKT